MIGVLGAGAFGASLAIALGREREVILWGRNLTGRDLPRLPGAVLPARVTTTADLAEACRADTLLLALPMQQLAGFARDHAAHLTGHPLVACCKGVDLATGLGPVEVLATLHIHPAVLTGPSFAADIARGLPTALTLACADDRLGETLQYQLSTPALRLYRTTDVIGAELGGALKNVIDPVAHGLGIGGTGQMQRRGRIGQCQQRHPRRDIERLWRHGAIKPVNGAGAGHRLQHAAKGAGRLDRRIGKAAGQGFGIHWSSPRTMVKKSTFVSAARAARAARAAAASAASTSSTSRRMRGAVSPCNNASATAARRA